MPFALRVSVSGLWLYVRDERANKVHLVAPQGHDHETVLLHDSPGGSQLSRISLDSAAIDLSGLMSSTGATVPALPDYILDLEELVLGLRCPRGNTQAIGNGINAVVSLRPDNVTGIGMEEFVIREGVFRTLAEVVDFSGVIVGGDLPLGDSRPTLSPVGGRLRLGLMHVQHKYIAGSWHELEQPAWGVGPSHFEMIYQLTLPQPIRAAAPARRKPSAGDPVCIGAKVALGD